MHWFSLQDVFSTFFLGPLVDIANTLCLLAIVGIFLRMLMYHTFPDLGIQGVYDHEPLVSYYAIPTLKGLSVLDAGCASGYWSKLFYEQGADVTSLDINLEAYKEVQKKCKMRTKQVHASVYDYNNPNAFDVVFCSSLLMHCVYPVKLLGHLRDQLKPGGLLILATAYNGDPGRSVHIEDHRGRNATEVETRIESSNESLWWCGKQALKSMAGSVGFQNPDIVGEFVLTTTDHGRSIGHHYSTPHIVLHANK